MDVNRSMLAFKNAPAAYLKPHVRFSYVAAETVQIKGPHPSHNIVYIEYMGCEDSAAPDSLRLAHT